MIDSYLMSLSNDVNDFDVWSVILLPLCTQFNHLAGGDWKGLKFCGVLDEINCGLIRHGLHVLFCA